jgi:Cu+-exporting ATPase
MTGKRTARKPPWLMLAVISMFGLGALAVFVTLKQRSDVAAGAQVSAARTETVRIPIQGMVCTVCVSKIKKALQSLDGVQEVEVSLERREARLRCGQGKVRPDQLVAAISKLGYRGGTPVPEASQ